MNLEFWAKGFDGPAKCLRSAVALLALATASHAKVTAPGYSLLSVDNAIQVSCDPLAAGWTPASDSAAIVLRATDGVTLTYGAGGDLYQAATGAVIPLQISARATGSGAWLGGTPFKVAAPGWTDWQAWLNASQVGSASFEANQTVGLQIRVQLGRHGLLDPAGAYRQRTPLVITVSPN